MIIFFPRRIFWGIFTKSCWGKIWWKNSRNSCVVSFFFFFLNHRFGKYLFIFFLNRRLNANIFFLRYTSWGIFSKSYWEKMWRKSFKNSCVISFFFFFGLQIWKIFIYFFLNQHLEKKRDYIFSQEYSRNFVVLVERKRYGKVFRDSCVSFFFFFGLQIWNVLIYFFLIDIWSHTGLYFSPGAHSREYSRSLVGGKCDGKILRICVWLLFFSSWITDLECIYIFFFNRHLIAYRIIFFPRRTFWGIFEILLGENVTEKFSEFVYGFFLNFLNNFCLNAYTIIFFLRHTSWGIFAKFCCCCCWKITEEF